MAVTAKTDRINAAFALLADLAPGRNVPMCDLAADHGGSKAVHAAVRTLRSGAMGYRVNVVRDPPGSRMQAVWLHPGDAEKAEAAATGWWERTGLDL